MTEKERTLLAGCLKGDKAAWDAFVLQYSSLVFHTIKKTLSLYHAEPRSDLIEDLFQEFFLSVLRYDLKKLRQFRGEHGCSLATWLRMVAARLTIDFLRRQDLPPAPSPVEPILENPDASAALIREEEEGLISQTVAALAPRDQIFVDLCFHRELPPGDIAAILKISVNAVYTQKSRILSKLRAILRPTTIL